MFLFLFGDVVVECVSVLFDGEFFIVIHGDFDGLFSDDFFFWVVEVGDVGVFEGFFDGESVFGVEDEEFFEEVDGVFGASGEHLVEGFLFADVDGGEDVPGEL